MKRKRVAKSRFDQFYTTRPFARECYDFYLEDFGDCGYRMIEPSAGDGAFFELLPTGSIGYDIRPKSSGIVRANFLEVTLPTDRKNAVIGNPPFGRNASQAVRHFNRAAP